MSKIKEIIKVEKLSNGLISYEPVDITKYEGSCSEKALSYSFAMDILRKLIGRTLTTIDATIVDKVQNKAVKDIIRESFGKEMEFITGMVYNQDELDEMAIEATKDIPDDEMLTGVDIEEALGVE